MTSADPGLTPELENLTISSRTNDAPAASPDSFTVNEDGSLDVPAPGVLVNDTDGDDDALTVQLVLEPSHGALTLAANGSFTYSPAENYAGIDVFRYRVNDGSDNSVDTAVHITVTPVNDAPSFVIGADQFVLEDAGPQTVAPWTTALSAGAPDETAQALTFIVSSTNGALFAVPPAITAGGTLTYTPAPDANGSATVTVRLHDDGGTANGGIGISAPQVFTITVSSVNDTPSFVRGANQTVLEDAGAQTVAGWATALSAGAPDEAAQALNFIVTNNNGTLFAVPPAISAVGTLTFTPAVNTRGSATVTVQLHDNGGTTPGADTSVPQTFTITVSSVNDAPSFVKGANQTVVEDAGAQTVAGWATALSAGAPDEAGQALNFIVTNNNGALFAVPPAISAVGALTYTPASNASGSATVTVQLHDSGGTTPGADTSAPQTFTITVTPVNDAPSFVNGANQTVLEDAGPQTVTAWATALSAGGADETAQILNFIVSSTNLALFAVPPAIAPGGTLTYSPAANANGSATVTVRLHDNGGTANGGIDTSSPQTFTITVTPVNDAPSFTKGPDHSAAASSGAQTVVGWAGGISAGSNEASQTLNFLVSNDNNGLFVVQPAVSPAGTLTYTPTANGGVARVTVLVRDSGGTANGGVDSSVAQTFSITITVPPPVANTPPVVSDSVVWNGDPTIIEPVARARTPFTAAVSFTDAGALDVHTVTYSWGDATTSAGVVTEANGAGSAIGTHTYTQSGFYTVTVTVSDGVHATVKTLKQIVVVDPAGKYQTGLGSFMSPAGSFVSNPALAGLATINSLTAKYGPDGTLGYAGNTNAFRFTYSSGGLSFTSTKMTWLVVNGNKSWLKGEGNVTIAGATQPAHYLIATVDATTSPATDKVRVRIVSKATGNVLYDTQKSAIDTADATTPTPNYTTVSLK